MGGILTLGPWEVSWGDSNHGIVGEGSPGSRVLKPHDLIVADAYWGNEPICRMRLGLGLVEGDNFQIRVRVRVGVRVRVRVKVTRRTSQCVG